MDGANKNTQKRPSFVNPQMRRATKPMQNSKSEKQLAPPLKGRVSVQSLELESISNHRLTSSTAKKRPSKIEQNQTHQESDRLSKAQDTSDRDSKNDSHRTPTFLLPTLSALQHKNQRKRVSAEKGFSFARMKTIKQSYLTSKDLSIEKVSSTETPTVHRMSAFKHQDSGSQNITKESTHRSSSQGQRNLSQSSGGSTPTPIIKEQPERMLSDEVIEGPIFEKEQEKNEDQEDNSLKSPEFVVPNFNFTEETPKTRALGLKKNISITLDGEQSKTEVYEAKTTPNPQKFLKKINPFVNEQKKIVRKKTSNTPLASKSQNLIPLKKGMTLKNFSLSKVSDENEESFGNVQINNRKILQQFRQQETSLNDSLKPTPHFSPKFEDDKKTTFTSPQNHIKSAILSELKPAKTDSRTRTPKSLKITMSKRRNVKRVSIGQNKQHKTEQDLEDQLQKENETLPEPEIKFNATKSFMTGDTPGLSSTKSAVFSGNSVNFFQFNTNHDFSQNFQKATNTTKRTDTIMQKVRDNQRNMNPIIVTKGYEKVIQPVFMEATGSLCFSEFWSQDQKAQYIRGMEEENFKRVKLDEKLKDNLEGLYKPEKIRKNKDLQKQMEMLPKEEQIKSKGLQKYKSSIERHSTSTESPEKRNSVKMYDLTKYVHTEDDRSSSPVSPHRMKKKVRISSIITTPSTFTATPVSNDKSLSSFAHTNTTHTHASPYQQKIKPSPIINQRRGHSYDQGSFKQNKKSLIQSTYGVKSVLVRPSRIKGLN